MPPLIRFRNRTQRGKENGAIVLAMVFGMLVIGGIYLATTQRTIRTGATEIDRFKLVGEKQDLREFFNVAVGCAQTIASGDCETTMSIYDKAGVILVDGSEQFQRIGSLAVKAGCLARTVSVLVKPWADRENSDVEWQQLLDDKGTGCQIPVEGEPGPADTVGSINPESVCGSRPGTDCWCDVAEKHSQKWKCEKDSKIAECGDPPDFGDHISCKDGKWVGDPVDLSAWGGGSIDRQGCDSDPPEDDCWCHHAHHWHCPSTPVVHVW